VGVVLQGGAGSPGAWRGASLALASRFWPIEVGGAGWVAEHEPSRQGAGPLADTSLDARTIALGLTSEYRRDHGSWRWWARGGGTVGRLEGPAFREAMRQAVFGELSASLVRSAGRLSVATSMVLRSNAGTTDGERWTRADGRVALSAALGGLRGSVDATLGIASADGGAGRRFERFALGGQPSPFVPQPYLSQRLPLGAVPVGFAEGAKLQLYRASTRLRGWNATMVWASVSDTTPRFQRLATIEQEVAFPAIAFASLPSITLRFGAGYSFDEPFEKKARAFGSIIYRP
jgi:hypothetical protein